MMKNYYYLSVAFLAAMFFVSCSDSYDNKFLYVEKNNLPSNPWEEPRTSH